MNVCLYMAPLIAALSGGVQASDALRKEASTLFGRIEPSTNELRSRADVVLGRALFWDVRLSADGKTACASCHLARDWGADRRPFPIDARGKPTEIGMLNGYVVQRGAELGIATPVNHTLHALVRLREAGDELSGA